jgi:hypothetical protein
MVPSEYEDLLASAAVAVVATVDRSGRPQNTPMNGRAAVVASD